MRVGLGGAERTGFSGLEGRRIFCAQESQGEPAEGETMASEPEESAGGMETEAAEQPVAVEQHAASVEFDPSSDAGEVEPSEEMIARGYIAEQGYGEFFSHGAVILFGVEGPVFTDRVAEQKIENRSRLMAKLAVAMDQSGRASLEVASNGFVGFPQS